MLRPRTLLASAAAGVAAIALARHHAELREVRRGSRAATWAATRVVPRHRTGRLAQAAASWEPQRPGPGIGRVAVHAWAAPMTAAGLVLALASGVRPRWQPDEGVFLAIGAGGLARVAGVDANAVGHVVVCRRQRPSARLLTHELAHVRQAERLGPTLPLVYFAWLARYGYRDHPLERGARRMTRRQLGLHD